MRHGGENTSSLGLRVKMLILPQYRALQAQIGHWRVNSVLNLISRLFQVKMVDFKIQTSNTSLFFKTILISNKKYYPS